VVFRETTSGLEYLRHATDIGSGFDVRLGPYECRVFVDFRRVTGDVYGEVAARLGGRGVASIDAEVAALRSGQFEQSEQSVRPEQVAPEVVVPEIIDPVVARKLRLAGAPVAVDVASSEWRTRFVAAMEVSADLVDDRDARLVPIARRYRGWHRRRPEGSRRRRVWWRAAAELADELRSDGDVLAALHLENGDDVIGTAAGRRLASALAAVALADTGSKRERERVAKIVGELVDQRSG
jgi:hypothetical protein